MLEPVVVRECRATVIWALRRQWRKPVLVVVVVIGPCVVLIFLLDDVAAPSALCLGPGSSRRWRRRRVRIHLILRVVLTVGLRDAKAESGEPVLAVGLWGWDETRLAWRDRSGPERGEVDTCEEWVRLNIVDAQPLDRVNPLSEKCKDMSVSKPESPQRKRKRATHEELFDEITREGVKAFGESVVESLNLLESEILGPASEGRRAREELIDDAANRPDVRATKSPLVRYEVT